ncbi:molecular chaperone [Dyella solisilvae]|uniref:Molecular chaperone n=1 Tax=Dyella solisilvae TaxID=1920168 RepID=A0A370K3H1_9GAMM|nr:molecular chaperone [Dyella solisilvae]RDI97148.1 molecular chaperone [Dyella solisilvae]
MAHAASLQVTPVIVQFQPSEQARSITLLNTGKEPLQAQVRVQRWTQEQGQDRLTPADDVVASPAIVRVAPGDRQIVRVVRRQPAAPAQEQSFRLLVDELPSQAKPEHSGLTLLLRYSIPVFIVPAGVVARAPAGAAPTETNLDAVHARLVAGAPGTSNLLMRNDGPTHIRVSHLGLTSANGQGRVLNDGLVGYVLPGNQMTWSVNVPSPLPAGQILKARFNDDREARPVPLDVASR